MRLSICIAAAAVALLAGPDPAAAQDAKAASGAPNATTTIDGKRLPPPPDAFGGEIGLIADDSKQWWPPRVVPPEDAPNVLLIITDDSGWGIPSTFGGVVPHPTMDQLAAEGLSFTAIHSAALCSPTRAALITGRNHHNVGFGVISEQSTGFPGYNSIIAEDKATIGRILLDNGYNTSWFGKDHNTPAFQASQSGPFDQWPTGMGFEYFYGFVGGDANQWQPNLFRNTTQIYPFEGEPGWNLMTAMADDAIDWITRMHQIDPTKPFLVKFAPGATHAPHHPTQEWVEKIAAMNLFDDGWNKLQETIFAKQKEMGYFPKDAKITPWPSEHIPDWDTLTNVEKKLFIRQVEVFAAYSAYMDAEIGRVVQTLKDIGEYENTLIIYINGDNGTSAEGGLLGTPNEVAYFNGENMIPAEEQMKWYDVWGTEETYNHMAVGWTWAFDTPYPWMKQIASQLGGIRQNMTVTWPARISDKGGRRDQFLHIIDVVPTILDGRGDRRARAGGRHRPGADGRQELRLSLRREERRRSAPPRHPVFRDVRPVGPLARRLVPGHQGQPRALGRLRTHQPRPVEQPDVRALRPEDRSDPEHGHLRRPSRDGDAAEADVRAGGDQIPGLPARRLGRPPSRRAAAQHHRRADRVRLHPAYGRAARRATPRGC